MHMTAKFPGKCARTGAPIRPGDLIDYDRRARRATLVDQGNGINEIVIGGNAYYRNARGKCEDAPCCGCCTI